MDEKKHVGQKELNEQVKFARLCTGCGACVNLCPYQRTYEDKVLAIFPCDIDEGRCYAFCPRTPVDLEALRNRLFDHQDLTPEIGAVKSFYITRARNSKARSSAQHGGTVTALMSLALKEGIIDTVVLADRGESFLPEAVAETDPKRVIRHGKSSFVVSPGVAVFNSLAKGDSEKIGVVATPCQALAYAKMRMKPIAEKDNNIDKLKLVVGLFCGWALSWERLLALLTQKADLAAITGMDIPPSKYKMMHIYTDNGTIEVSIEEVTRCIKGACNYCFDMTAEFSDISVGSARLGEGWDEAKGWNQVIARTELGIELIKLAKKKRLLEFREVPEGNLERLKVASMNKKRAAIKNLRIRTHGTDDLIYLDKDDPVFKMLIMGG
jgi:coenzyme F420 hydrogenase subunit beta